jgi:hypothetical protein
MITSLQRKVGARGIGDVWALAVLAAITPASVAPNAMLNFEVVIRTPVPMVATPCPAFG